MRYLVFDIECCDGKHICEFGYVIADENFNVLEKDVLLINPEKPFNLKNRPGQKDLDLYFPDEEYYAAPLFPERYERIKELIEYGDQMIIGHAISNDISFLKTACKRYDLNRFADFYFLDSQRVYSEYANRKNGLSLENAETELHIDKPVYLHKSDDDALLTLELIKSVCRQLEVSVSELMELCPTACGKSEHLWAVYKCSSFSYMLQQLDKHPECISKKKRERLLGKIIEGVAPIQNPRRSPLNNRTVCFSPVIEKNSTREAVVLIQLMAEVGCSYSRNAKECDYYVTVEEELMLTEEDIHTRYHHAVYGDNKDKITVVIMEELLEMLGLSDDALRKTAIKTSERSNSGSKNKRWNTERRNTTKLGDILKAQGLVLSGRWS